MRFIVDAQLPQRSPLGSSARPRSGSTKDEDFAVRAQLRPGPPVVWICVGNTRNADLLRRAAAVWPRVIEALTRGETPIELS